MKYDMISDAHIDINRNWPFRIEEYKNKDSNILVVAGDTANDVNLAILTLKEWANHYEYVLFVDGNHEHYIHTDLAANQEKLKTTFKDNDRIHYLADSSFVIDRIAFIGCNGWYDFGLPNQSFDVMVDSWGKHMNDSHINFGSLRPDDVAKEQNQYILSEITKYTDDPNVAKIVITTHTVPHHQLIRIVGDPKWDNLSGAYCNTLMEKVFDVDKNKKIVFWNYGHTHEKNMRSIDHITYVNNSIGYRNEHHGIYFILQVNV